MTNYVLMAFFKHSYTVNWNNVMLYGLKKVTAIQNGCNWYEILQLNGVTTSQHSALLPLACNTITITAAPSMLQKQKKLVTVTLFQDHLLS